MKFPKISFIFLTLIAFTANHCHAGWDQNKNSYSPLTPVKTDILSQGFNSYFEQEEFDTESFLNFCILQGFPKAKVTNLHKQLQKKQEPKQILHFVAKHIHRSQSQSSNSSTKQKKRRRKQKDRW